MKYCAFASDNLFPMPSLLAKVVDVQVRAKSMSVGVLLLSSVGRNFGGLTLGLVGHCLHIVMPPTPAFVCLCIFIL